MGPHIEHDGAVEDLATLVRRAAYRFGDRRALHFDATDESLSFAEIDLRTDTIANVLRSLGHAPGDRVAIMLPNRPEFPLSWLGAAKAGVAIVPLNTFYKVTDASYILRHSGATTILTEDPLVPLALELAAGGTPLEQVVCVDGARDGALGLPELAAQVGPQPRDHRALGEQTVNIQYTSGTTGHPKGCVLSHYYWCRLGRIVAAGPPSLGQADVMLTAQPFYYMDPQWNLAASLLAGAELIVLDRFHPASFWDKVREHRVTFFYCLGMMPTALLAMAPTPLDRQHGVRSIACSAIPTRLHAALEERWGVPWYEAFGMTESGGDLRVMPEDHDETLGTGCIGRPYADREVRVVGRDDIPLARGLTGEMVLRGPGMMDAYFGDQEATATVFRNGWLHTGDLVRQDENGRLFYLGRTKDMIRRSGENISSAEVEGVLVEHPKVVSAACVPVPDDLRGEEVKAYVVPDEDETSESLPPGELVSWCGERLAYFKVPRFWAYVDDLPRTPSERVAKSRLVEGVRDLRAGAYDAAEKRWR